LRTGSRRNARARRRTSTTRSRRSRRRSSVRSSTTSARELRRRVKIEQFDNIYERANSVKRRLKGQQDVIDMMEKKMLTTSNRRNEKDRTKVCGMMK